MLKVSLKKLFKRKAFDIFIGLLAHLIGFVSRYQRRLVRAFSTMQIVKSKLRNKINGDWFNQLMQFLLYTLKTKTQRILLRRH
jgi:hypothetical protein